MMKIRKYMLAVFLSRYDYRTQKAMRRKICVAMRIKEQQLMTYINAVQGDAKAAKLTTDKALIVARIFDVGVQDIVAKEATARELSLL